MGTINGSLSDGPTNCTPVYIAEICNHYKIPQSVVFRAKYNIYGNYIYGEYKFDYKWIEGLDNSQMYQNNFLFLLAPYLCVSIQSLDYMYGCAIHISAYNLPKEVLIQMKNQSSLKHETILSQLADKPI